MKPWALIVLAALPLAACATTDITPMDKDTYLVAKRGPTVGFSAPIKQTADVYRRANEFCAKQGKKVETVKLDQVDSGMARSASATLQFRCI